MSQLQLYKGLNSEDGEKKDKIANGGLVITKKENNSSVGNLYINDGGTHVQLSSDEAVINITMSEEDNTLIVSKINGESNAVLTVDDTLLNNSSNPVENKAIYTKFELQDADIENNVKTPLNTLIGNDNGLSVRDISIDVLTKQLVPDTAQESLDTLEEIADWIQKHPQDAAAMNTAIQNNADEIDDIQLDIMRLDVQSDWELNNNQSHAYIQNKPMIKKGAKSTSIIIGDSIANGEYSIAAGTNDTSLLGGSLGSTVSVDKPTAQGDLSLALGPGSIALTSGTIALGAQASAGAKGFYWWSIDFSNSAAIKITLSTTQKSILNWSKDWDTNATNQLSQWAVNDVISFVANKKYGECAVITNIDSSNGIITVSSLPITAEQHPSVGSATYDDYAVYVPKKPQVGVVNFGLGALSVGLQTNAAGSFSSALGYKSRVMTDFGHSEGRETVAGYAAHAECYQTSALGIGSHSEGGFGMAQGDYTHTEGYRTYAKGVGAHGEGYVDSKDADGNEIDITTFGAHGNASHTEGVNTLATGKGGHAEGRETKATGDYSHSQGLRTESKGAQSCASGNGSRALGNQSTALGLNTTALGLNSYAEGGSNIIAPDSVLTATNDNIITTHKNSPFSLSKGNNSHSEGNSTMALGIAGHSEGRYSVSVGDISHAEGDKTYAYGVGSHGEGGSTEARGNYSHTQGLGTVATCKIQDVIGKYNLLDDNSINNGYGNYAHIIGGGSSNTDRKNIHTIDWAGNAWFSGTVKIGGTDYSSGSEIALKTDISNLDSKISINTSNISSLTTKVNDLENKVPTNVVDLSSAQTVSGVKTFSNGIKIGDATLTYSSDKLIISFS